jgi:hypothetical protein
MSGFGREQRMALMKSTLKKGLIMKATLFSSFFAQTIASITPQRAHWHAAFLILLLSSFHSRAHETTESSESGQAAGQENTFSAGVSTTGSVRLVGQLAPFGGKNRYGDIWGDGNYAYIGSSVDETVGIIDISDPAAPKLAGSYSGGFGGSFQDIQVKNGIGYFASFSPERGSGVHLVDVSNPAQPVLLKRLTRADKGFNSIHNLFIDGNFLYQADNQTPVVKVFDVSTPSAPIFIRDIRTTDPQRVHDMTVINNRLYTSGMGGKTDIYDVTDIVTKAPTLLGTIASGASSHSSWVNQAGSILATCSELDAKDLRIYDISAPGSPILLSKITSRTLGLDAATPHNPVIVGDLLFVSWYQAGLQVLNIRDPAAPVLVGAFDTFPGGIAQSDGVVADGVPYDGCWGVYPLLGLDKVLLSDFDGGLFIVNATSLASADSDGDGLPDAWEIEHGLDPAVAADRLQDTDGDGATDLEEFLSGTNPRDKSDFVRITGISKSPRETTITFSGLEGRAYRVERNSRATTDGWLLVRDEIAGVSGGTTVTHTNALARLQFYRVLVRP